MAVAKQRDEWSRTSSVLAWLVNTRAGRKGKLAKPSQFDPFHKKVRKVATADEMAELKSIITGPTREKTDG